MASFIDWKAARKAAVAKCVAATKAWEKALNLPPQKVDRTPQQVAVAEFLKTEPFGCHQANVVKLMSALFGFEILPNMSKKPRVEFGVCMVPNANPNSHNYVVGKVAMVVNPGDIYEELLRRDGTVGNYIADRAYSIDKAKSYLRPATKSEIEKFIAELEDKYFAKTILPKL